MTTMADDFDEPIAIVINDQPIAAPTENHPIAIESTK